MIRAILSGAAAMVSLYLIVGSYGTDVERVVKRPLPEVYTSVENLFLGQELRPARLDEVKMEVKSWELLRELSAQIPTVRIPIASLSGGQRQTVAIARSLLGDPKIIILDEPTAALGVAQTEQVLKLVRRLADKGLSVVLISHNLNDVFQVADRISVLYLGRMAAQVRTADVTRNQVVELITGGQTDGLAAGPAAGAQEEGR